MNKSKHDLEILESILDSSFRKPNRIDIIFNLQLIKENLQHIHEIDLKQNLGETIDIVCRRRNLPEMKSGIEIIKSYLQKKVNEGTFEFLDTSYQFHGLSGFVLIISIVILGFLDISHQSHGLSGYS